MGKILKAYRYRLVDNHAFDLPLPLSFEVYREDMAVARYNISEDEAVSYEILTKFKENMLTTIRRPLMISDIYYLFSCRVFQDKTPFTYPELTLMGLEKYSVYEILRRTHGITPFDEYWLKFEGESLTYDEALEQFNKLTAAAVMPAPALVPAAEPAAAAPAPQHKADIGEILNQHTVDFDALKTSPVVTSPVVIPDAPRAEAPLVNNKMSEDEIESLLRSTGLAEDEAPAEPESTGMMSQDEIEKLLAANAPTAPEPAPAPAEPEQTSGGKMSQDEIEKLLAANAPTAPEPAPAPAEPEQTSGGKMSQDEIEKLLAANAPTAPEPAPAPAEPEQTSGGKMSQDDIEALLKSMQDDAAGTK